MENTNTMSINLKSPLPRVGGKYFLKDWIIEKIPKGHKVFIEPFCGSCVISLNKPPSEITIVNDLDSNLISFWRILQDTQKRKQLAITLDNMIYARVTWQQVRSRWKSEIFPDNPVQKIAEWYFLNRSSYASDIQHGGFMSASKGRNPCASFRNAVLGFDDVGEIIKGFIVENLPYEECIRRFDSVETVFYIDSPYYGSEDYYGKGNFSLDDHYRLSEILHGIRGKTTVSHYANELYDRLYQGWYRYEFQSFKGAHKADEGKEKPKTIEVLYCNFQPKLKTRSLFNELQ